MKKLNWNVATIAGVLVVFMIIFRSEISDLLRPNPSPGPAPGPEVVDVDPADVARESMLSFAELLGHGYLELADRIDSGELSDDRAILDANNAQNAGIRKKAFSPVFELTGAVFEASGDQFDAAVRSEYFRELAAGFMEVKTRFQEVR